MGNTFFSFFWYGFSVALLIFVTQHISQKLCFFWQKMFVAVTFGLLLLSAVWHTKFYGENIYKAEIDQEGFYYPKNNNYYTQYFGDKTSEIFINNCLTFKRHNALYPLIYWKIKHVFGDQYFYEGFFFTCILNSILFLFSLYYLFKIFSIFQVSTSFLIVCLFIFLQPFVIFRNAIPLANSLTIFSMVLFFYTMVFNKHFCLKILCTYFMYLSHKTLYVPAIFAISYLFFKEDKICIKKPVKICILLICGIFIVVQNQNVTKRDLYISHNLKHGDSYIPTLSSNLSSPFGYSKLFLKITNFYFSPLCTNSTLFFYKTKEGHFLGWIYAIYINFIVLFMLIKICFLFKRFFYLTPQMKQLVFISIMFIISFSLEGVRLTNYLNANRHATNFLLPWILLMLILESSKKQNLKSKNNS